MKKLSLLLLTIFVSATGWTQNPYAYGLSSKLSDDKQNLTINYSLNVKATSVQIEIVDENGNTCYTKQGAPVNKGANSITISTASLPREKALNWKVIVNGGNTGTQPTVPVWAVSKRPNSVHGVAVNNDQQSANFGKIYAAESMMTNATNAKWIWLNSNVPALLEYNQDLSFKAFHKKSKQNGTAVSNFSTTEPNRVRVSADGRIFVASYHSNSSTAVWEYTGSGNYNTIIPRTAGSNLRPTSIDVKGSGKDLKLLVTYYDNKVDETNMIAKVYCYEYPIGTSTGKYTAAGTLKAQYNDYKTDPVLPGLLYQAVKNGYSVYNVGMISAVYGENDMIWMKIDFYINKTIPSKVIAFNSSKTTPLKENDLPLSNNYYYGGDGIVVKGNLLVTGNNCAMHFYQTNTNGSITKKYNDLSTINNNTIYTNIWINDLAIDHANNLYVVSAYEGNMMVVALPNGGKTITNAAKQYAFTVSDPIPNILATDLRFAPNGNSDSYVFSFNVNTTPQVAQIRFYKSYGDNGENDMKKNLAKINADDYQGGNAITPSFVYDIPTDQLKQGKISVSLGMCGGIIEGGKITNGKLPRGEWYWSVYVEAPRKSSVFAPIYRLEGVSTNTGQKDTEGNDIYNHERRHATVNNYPETDMFGSIIVAHNPSVVSNDNNRPERGLKIYGINPNGNDEQSSLNNNTRYHQTAVYLNGNATSGKLHYPRRMVVAPDGKIYIADEGSQTQNDAHWKKVANGPVMYTQGGVKLWDPANPDKFTLFSDNKICLSTGVALWDNKLYATNTYNEYAIHFHGTTNYTKEQQENPNQYGWNGFVEYTKLNDFFTTSNDGTWNNFWKNGRAQEVALYRGDASGNNCLVAMDKGIWICQHREHTVAIKDALQEPYGDNIEAYVLSFVPYDRPTPNEEYGPRTWRSSTTLGVWWSAGKRTDYEKSTWSQTETSPLQSTPGAGLAYKAFKDKDGNILKDEAGNPHEYLYVVNHDGNIVVIQITQWTGNTPSLKYLKTLVTPAETKGDRTAPKKGFTSQTWHTAFITSMNFDYAGNLVTTTGKGNHDNHQDIIVYTMPYDRVNAREIQAPNSCRYIPERVSHLNMGDGELNNIISENQGNTCHVDIYRPMFNTAFSTICLPFDVNLSEASANEYKDAKLMRFAEAVITDINKEKMLELRFTEITNGQLEAGIPYLIQPQEPITQIVHLAQEVSFKLLTPEDLELEVNFTDGDQNNSITFKGIIPYQQIEVDPNKPWPLIVVDNNRLAEVSSTGYINGFRAYFQLAKELAPGTKVGISARKPTPTNVITIDGKRVNIEKFLREGRVYIRVGDTLYTINGEKL